MPSFGQASSRALRMSSGSSRPSLTAPSTFGSGPARARASRLGSGDTADRGQREATLLEALHQAGVLSDVVGNGRLHPLLDISRARCPPLSLPITAQAKGLRPLVTREVPVGPSSQAMSCSSVR